MNLLGAIGTLMGGSGLSKVLKTVYGENAVLHMMKGKSVQRAFRGHLLVDKCLNKLVIADMIDEDTGSKIWKQLKSTITSNMLATIKQKIYERKVELQDR